MATVALSMIVKNEAHVILRALSSVLPYIDSWAICDTGSTDGTQEIIREALKGIPGELREVPWVDFGKNRTQAVQLAQTKADYVLILDADLVLNVYDPDFKEKLDADAYELRYEGNLDYTNTRLVSSKCDWFYVGVTHEYITLETEASPVLFPQLTLTDYGDGGNRADKFERDIRLLSKALEIEPDNERYVFYLAQSYKDLGEFSFALRWYKRRAKMRGFDEEKWYAMLMAGKMMLLLDIPWAEVQAQLLAAFAYRPTRIEPLYEIVKHYRATGEYATGFMFAAIWGHGFPYPTDRLFIDRPVYTSLFEEAYVFLVQKMQDKYK